MPRIIWSGGKRSSIFKIVFLPPIKFLQYYFFRLGFLDGRMGLIICIIHGVSAFLKYCKLSVQAKSGCEKNCVGTQGHLRK